MNVSLFRAESNSDSLILPVVPAERDDFQLLSFAQQRLWLLAQMADPDHTYHVPLHLRLRGRLDSVALRRALG